MLHYSHIVKRIINRTSYGLHDPAWSLGCATSLAPTSLVRIWIICWCGFGIFNPIINKPFKLAIMWIRNKISPDNVYFIIITIVDWLDIFTRPVYKHIIVDSLNYFIANKGLQVYCWCLMGNHLHLIASASEGNSLSDILRDFKKFTSKERSFFMMKD